ncbi:MAG: hypothetical protein CK424_06785 [Legionella sp.]|nr:MAG: hypothetical protein CK424_06785 [Legionella sp.]
MKKIAFIVTIASLISACSSILLEPGAAMVISSPNRAPKACKYLGQVTGNQGNFFTGAYTSNRNLEIGAMNDLKNQAYKLGANYIQIITSRAGISGSMGGGQGVFGAQNGYVSGHSSQTNITNVGNAYHCPPKLIGLQ